MQQRVEGGEARTSWSRRSHSKITKDEKGKNEVIKSVKEEPVDGDGSKNPKNEKEKKEVIKNVKKEPGDDAGNKNPKDEKDKEQKKEKEASKKKKEKITNLYEGRLRPRR